LNFFFSKDTPTNDSVETDMKKFFEEENSIWNLIVESHNKQHSTETPPKLLFVSHNPPYGTIADTMAQKNHIGSTALADTILKFSPQILATFHGHIHETVFESKQYTQKLGDTNIFCSGNRWNLPECAIVIVDFDKNSCINSKRILV